MNYYYERLKKLGLEIPSILLPKAARESAELKKWPVIACDQFTQDRGFWEKVKTGTAGTPSSLNLIFPEAYLSDAGASGRIADIHLTMKRYLAEGVFDEPKKGFFYIERDTPYNKKRRGLIAAVDLDQYDWHSGTRPLIRSTEGTVADRLPPRMDIRRGAPLELPHILLLIDDDTDNLLPSLGRIAEKTAPVYSTQLMMDCGSVTGWFLDTEAGGQSDEILSLIALELQRLCDRSCGRYTEDAEALYTGSPPFLYAAGDGNHSLAAAKGIWQEYRELHGGAGAQHPCRYALVEIENIYDPAIQFEPIHRLVFDFSPDEIISVLSGLPGFSCRSAGSAEELSKAVCGGRYGDGQQKGVPGNIFGVISRERYALVETSAGGIATACLQPLLDSLVSEKSGLIDYIHDEEELFRLALNSGGRKAAGILLPPVHKAGLFETVARYGPLPRKSFSMGHSCEKRFYLESRALF
ncbi:MAG: DUF1015 domain-containing protein [Treponema sp.]|jgi:hypothetical protein|nr:DUF1015 domain-containing protein [Treponema sp.]